MRVRKRKFQYLILVAMFVCSGPFAKAQNSVGQANQILQRMTAMYADLSSYQDSGVVRLAPQDTIIANRSHHVQASAQSTILVSFKTYYVRPKKLRFDWIGTIDKADRESTISFDGKQAYLWMPTFSDSKNFELTKSEDFGFQLDQALSSSLGSVFFVPTLLIKGVIVSTFADSLRVAKQVAFVKEEVIDEETCYVLRAELSGVPWMCNPPQFRTSHK